MKLCILKMSHVKKKTKKKLKIIKIRRMCRFYVRIRNAPLVRPFTDDAVQAEYIYTCAYMP